MKKTLLTSIIIGAVATTLLVNAQPVDTRPVQDTATYFAEIGGDNRVKRVIVADQAFIDSGAVGDPKNWVQTYMDKSARVNYAGIGDEFNKTLDVFVKGRQSSSAVYNAGKAAWEIPIIISTTSTSTI